MTWRADTIFCDDIRQEVSGKHILIGVYGADLVPGTLPAMVPIGMWIRIVGLPVGRRRFEIQLVDPGGRQAGTLNGETEVLAGESPAIFALSGLPVELKTTGDIVVRFALDGGEPVEVGRLRVSPPPAAGQPFPVQSE